MVGIVWIGTLLAQGKQLLLPATTERRQGGLEDHVLFKTHVLVPQGQDQVAITQDQHSCDGRPGIPISAAVAERSPLGARVEDVERETAAAVAGSPGWGATRDLAVDLLIQRQLLPRPMRLVDVNLGRHRSG